MYCFKKMLIAALAIIVTICFFEINIASPKIIQASGTFVQGNIASNISNYGLVAEYRGMIYFANTDSGGRLYRMNPDGTNYVRIANDEVQYINIVNDIIYYSNLSDNGRLYSIRINGTGRTRLNTDHSAFINVVNDTIFYVSVTDNWRLRRRSINGSGAAYLGNQIRAHNLNVVGENAYYISLADNLMYRMNISTGVVAAVGSERAYQMVVYEPYIFYVNLSTFRVQRINSAGPDSQRPMTYTTYRCTHLAVYNGIVYFSMADRGGIIGSLRIDDVSSDTDVSTIFGACLNAASGHLYFMNIYERYGDFVHYANMHRITYNGRTTQSMRNIAAAARVMVLIDALPNPEAARASDSRNVVAARMAFDYLSSAERGIVVSSRVNKLRELEERLGLTGPQFLATSVYRLDRNQRLVTGIARETPIATLRRNFSGNNGQGTIRVFGSNNREVTTGFVGTGMRVRLIHDNRTIDEFTVLIYGDVTGTGTIGAMDLLRVQRHILRLSTLEGVHFKAADVNRDGNITAIDLLRIQRHILRFITIS